MPEIAKIAKPKTTSLSKTKKIADINKMVDVTILFINSLLIKYFQN